MKKNILFTVTYFISILLHAQNLEWAKGIGGTGLDQGRSLCNDAQGNVYITGKFSNTVDFDPGAGVFNLTAAGSYDAYVLKLDASGNFVWAKKFGGVNEEFSENIALDANGNIIVGGHFTGTADFDPGTATYNLTSNGMEDIFILKLNASGNFVWAKSIGAANADYNNEVTVDPSGNVYAVGQFTFTVDFDPGPATYNLNWTNGGHYVLKLDASGNFVWAYGLNAIITDIHFDYLGNYYYTGYFGGTVDFDPGAGVYNLATTYTAMFVVKFNSSGTLVWANRMECNGTIESNAICTDLNGNVYTTGTFEGAADFNPNAAPYIINSNGDWDVFIHKFDANGTIVWVNSIGASLREYAFDIDVDASNNIYVAGAFQGTVDFDPYIASTHTITATALVDAYTLKLNPSGSFAWVVPFQSFDQTYNYSIAANNDGSAYVTGDFSASTDFDPAAGFQFVYPIGGADAYTCKLGTCAALPTTGNISGNIVPCAGTVVTYSINSVPGATTYNWTVPSGCFINSGQNTNSVNVYIGSLGGNISVTPSNGCTSGTVSSISISITPLPNPSFIVANGNTIICSGANVTLSGNVGGTWNTGATTPSINVNVGGSYFVTNTNACGSVNSNQINVTLLQAPVASSISANGNTTFCAGGSVTLSGNAGGTWNTGASTASITVTSSGTYYVTNSNSCGSVQSNHIIVTVNPTATPSNISANGNTTFCSGGSVTLNGNVGGTWNTGATTASITVNSAGVYYVTNTNSCGSVFSNQITVSVNQLPITSTIIANGNTTICSGNTLTLSGNVGGLWNTGSSANSITVSSSGNYFVTNSNSCGTVQSDTITVSVIAAPLASTISAAGNTTFCAGNNVTLNGNIGGTWNTGATSASITVSNGGVYYVTNSNACGSVYSNQISVTVNPLPIADSILAGGVTTFCSGDFVVLFGNSGGIWNTGTSATSINVTSSGNYFVTYSNSCGNSYSNTIPVTVESLPVAPVIQANGATSFCDGGSVLLTGNTNGIWNTGIDSNSISITTTGEFYVNINNSCGYDSSNHIVVEVWPLPTTPTITQSGNTLQASGAYPAYQWYLNNNLIAGAVHDTINAINAGDYTVVAVDTNGCLSVPSPTYAFVPVGMNNAVLNQVAIYPNPAHESTYLIWNGASTNVTIRIKDALGKIIYENNFNGNNKLEIFTSNWANGYYSVEFFDQQKIHHLKLIKN